MLRFPSAIAVFALALFAAIGLGPTRAETGRENGTALEQETFSLINQYRHANHLPALIWQGEIATVARVHSKDMATGDVDFGHDGFSGRISHLRSVMQGLQGAGENVLMTDNPDQVARKAVELWLRSPHHLENIRGNYNYSGLGIWTNKDGAIYFTQIFVKIVPPAPQVEAASEPGLVTPFGMLAAPETRPAR
jgi:uncharacterized protein YkwD